MRRLTRVWLLAGLVVLLPHVAWGALAVVGTATTSEAAAVNTHAINIGSPAAGELVIVCMATRNATAVDALTGWTELVDASSSTSTFWIAYRRATGTEGATIAPVTTGASSAGAIAFRITGHHGTSNPEVGTTSTDTSGTDVNPDPPNGPASWGAEANLFIACAAMAANVDVTVFPADYGSNNVEAGGTGGTNGGIGAATRLLAAAADNPGAFTIALGTVWQANTIVVRPAAVTASGMVNTTPVKSLINGGLVK